MSKTQKWLLVWLLCWIATMCFFLAGADTTGVGTSTPGGFDGGDAVQLDLPYDAVAEAADETDAPEIVTFYGQIIEANCIVFCIDRSGSMRDTELPVAKRELYRSISELSEFTELAVIFFSVKPSVWPATRVPQAATPWRKAEAKAFLATIQAEGNTCPIPALLEGLSVAQASQKDRKVLVYLSDGGGTCPSGSHRSEAEYLEDTLRITAQRNHGEVAINTIGICSPPALNERFLQRLASENGGTYARIR